MRIWEKPLKSAHPLHLPETRRLLAMTAPSKDDQNAIRLLEWITARNLEETTPRFLQQYGSVRNKQERNKAIQIFIENYYLKCSPMPL